MKRVVKGSAGVLLALVMLLACGAGVQDSTEAALSETAAYLLNAVTEAQVGSVGGEWAVLGLARFRYDVPAGYFETYYSNVETYAEACGGVLHTRKYTEYSRVILALTAIGKNPADVAGYNLLTPLGDFDATVRQGVNGPVWALIALDCGGYAMPLNPAAETQATREMYVERILSKQLPGGGFSLTGEEPADPSMTAMALLALAGYTDRSGVASCVDGAVTRLSEMQDETGGYASEGAGNCESCAQVMLALCRLGISQNDGRFVKNGNTLLGALLSYRAGDGGFLHTLDSSASNQMATEQAMLALAAFHRSNAGQSGLFDIVGAAQLSSDVWGGTARHSLLPYYRKDAPVWEGGL